MVKENILKKTYLDKKTLLDICIVLITISGLVFYVLPTVLASPSFMLCIMLACVYPVYIQRQSDAPYARRYAYDAARYNIMLIWAVAFPYFSSSLAYAIFFTKLLKQWLRCFPSQYTELYCCMMWFSLFYLVGYCQTVTTISTVCSYILAADISYYQMREHANKPGFSLARCSNMFAQFVSEKISTTI